MTDYAYNTLVSHFFCIDVNLEDESNESHESYPGMIYFKMYSPYNCKCK